MSGAGQTLTDAELKAGHVPRIGPTPIEKQMMAEMVTLDTKDNIVLENLDQTNLLLKEKHDVNELEFLRALSIQQQSVA